MIHRETIEHMMGLLGDLLGDCDTYEERGKIDYAVRRLFQHGCTMAADIARKDGVDAYKESAWFKLTCAIENAFPEEVAAMFPGRPAP